MPAVFEQNYVKRILGTAEDYRRLYGSGVLTPIEVLLQAGLATDARFDSNARRNENRDALRAIIVFVFLYLGVCAAGVSGPICAIDPATAPKVMAG